MKKFFTAASLQQKGNLDRYVYQAMDNELLQLDQPVSFPILATIGAYVKPNEEFEIIALMADTERGRFNYQVLCDQAAELSREKGLLPPVIRLISFTENQLAENLAELFLNTIEQIGDGDQLYACMTFGTKPVSTVLMTALQFGYRSRKNVTIDCVVYGEVVRPTDEKAIWFGRIYDQTGLLQLGETARILAESGVADPGAVIRRFLKL